MYGSLSFSLPLSTLRSAILNPVRLTHYYIYCNQILRSIAHRDKCKCSRTHVRVCIEKTCVQYRAMIRCDLITRWHTETTHWRALMNASPARRRAAAPRFSPMSANATRDVSSRCASAYSESGCIPEDKLSSRSNDFASRYTRKRVRFRRLHDRHVALRSWLEVYSMILIEINLNWLSVPS